MARPMRGLVCSIHGPWFAHISGALHHAKDFRPAVEPGGADRGFFHARNELADGFDRTPQGIGDRAIDQSERILRDHNPLWHRRFAVIPKQHAADP